MLTDFPAEMYCYHPV